MKKILKPFCWIFFGTVMACIGAAFAGYVTVYTEANDRMKYEAAYARAYYKVLRKLEAGETEQAKDMLNWYVDAHFVTLNEYRYLQNSLLSDDINRYLCEVAMYKLQDRSNIKVENEELQNHVIELSKTIVENDC